MADEELEEGGEERTTYRGIEDDEQAEWLAGAFENGIRFDHTTKRWHIWDGTLWAPDQTKEVQRRVMDLARRRLYAVAEDPTIGKNKREALLKLYRKLLDVNATERALTALSTRHGYKTDGSDWDQDPNLLGCANGIVDLRLNALIEDPGPELLVTRSTGHDFRPIAGWPEAESRAPRFMAFLGEVTSDDWQLAAFYLLWFGYSLFGHTEEQRFLILTGLGRNGKGALVTAMRHVFGEYSAKADANLYMRSKWGSARSDQARADLIELKGKRLAAMSEPDGGAFNEEMLKAHTGGDPITARSLHSNNVLTWTPTHSITFLTNEPPKVNDIGPSMAARVMVADFRERFDGDKEDKKLYGKLEAEAEGILAILCWAAKAWFDSGSGLSLPERVEKASADYLSNNDPIAQALEEAFVIEQGASALASHLYDAYTDWHTRTVIDGEPLTATAFGLLLARKGLHKKRRREGAVYIGIRPRRTEEMPDDEA